MGKILWLASYPRSGNTWLRAFLHNLLRNPATPYDINRLQDLTLIDGAARWYRMLDSRPLTELTKEEVAALRPRTHAAITRAAPDTVFVKTHNALVEDRGSAMITLEHTVGAIYVVRNPLDVAVSYADHFGLALEEAVAAMNRPRNQSIANQADFAYELHGTWSENVASWTAAPHPALLVVRYEDMLADPAPTFNRIAEFLGMRLSPARIERAIQSSAFAVLKGQEMRRGFSERSLKSTTFFRAGRVGQGAGRLQARLVDALCEVHHDQMLRFGYLSLRRKEPAQPGFTI